MYRVEVSRAMRRWRTWILAAVLAGVPTLFTIVLATTRPSGGEGPPMMGLAVRNGFFAAVVGLVITQTFLLPMAASMIAGDAIAGDASKGVLRYLLIRPVGRMRLVTAKYGAVMTVLALEVLVIVIVGIVVGGAMLGYSTFPTVSGSTVSAGSAALRIIGATSYVLIGLAPIAAIGIFASTVTDSAPGAIGMTLGFFIVEQIVASIPNLSLLHPYMIGQYQLAIVDLFRAPVAWSGLTRGLALSVGYTAVFLSASLYWFRRKDIAS